VPEDNSYPFLRIRVQFKFSDSELYNKLADEWEEYIKEDFTEYENIKRFIELLKEPFNVEVVRRIHNGQMLSPDDQADL
jgi:hypothetical protein